MVGVGIRQGQQRLRVCYFEALFLILHTYLIMYAMRLCFVTIALFSGDQVCSQKEKKGVCYSKCFMVDETHGDYTTHAAAAFMFTL